MKTQLICAVVVEHHPISHDTRYFLQLFSQMIAVTPMWIVVLDKGYDAEPVHRIMIRNKNMLSVIPARGNNTLCCTHGKYRKQMRREFDHSLYYQQNKAETVFLVIKRRFGSEIKSYNKDMRTKELLYCVLAWNCHRMCMISALVCVMISRKPNEDSQFNWKLKKLEH